LYFTANVTMGAKYETGRNYHYLGSVLLYVGDRIVRYFVI
jgi:hypothetical protein